MGVTCSAGLMSRVVLRGCGAGAPILFEGSTVLFRGCGAPVVRGRVPQCHGVDTSLTAQHRIVAEMAAQRRGLAEQCRAGFPGGVRESAWRGFVLDLGVHDVPEHLMLWSGEQVRRHGPEVGTHVSLE
jgi:hypothetical protein